VVYNKVYQKKQKPAVPEEEQKQELPKQESKLVKPTIKPIKKQDMKPMTKKLTERVSHCEQDQKVESWEDAMKKFSHKSNKGVQP
jgi:hypothetical protein